MSQSAPRCVYDARTDTPLFLIGGAWHCQTHAKCATCGMPLVELDGPAFKCLDDAHEDLGWCSWDCLEAMHPEPEED